jgi:hypothetical protein
VIFIRRIYECTVSWRTQKCSEENMSYRYPVENWKVTASRLTTSPRHSEYNIIYYIFYYSKTRIRMRNRQHWQSVWELMFIFLPCERTQSPTDVANRYRPFYYEHCVQYLPIPSGNAWYIGLDPKRNSRKTLPRSMNTCTASVVHFLIFNSIMP